MNGKIIVIAILAVTAVFGAVMYYMQVYGYYEEVTPQPGRDVLLTLAATGEPAPIAYSDFRAIDADSSPIRYRACFTTTETPASLAQTRVPLAATEPRIGPGWFDCFDPAAIDEALNSGTAQTFLGTKNIAYGVDRIVVITDAGKGYVWHELNHCGEKAYDGTVVGEECPPRPEPAN